MIKLNEIINKYGDYEVDEEKLKGILVKPNPKSVWDLKKGDEYYAIAFAEIYNHKWGNIPYDKKIREMGDVFLTKEEAEFEVKRRKIEAILLKYGRRSFKYTGSNYSFTYDHEYKRFRFYSNYAIQRQGFVFFDTEELCRQAIEEIGEDNIKKYLFGVDEDD